MDPSPPPTPQPAPDSNDPERQRAFAALITAHYDSLRQIAERTLHAEHETAGFGAAAVEPTSLVTEAVIRLMNQHEVPQTQSHLRGLASVFMTRVIADRRRRRLGQLAALGGHWRGSPASVVVDRANVLKGTSRSGSSRRSGT